MGTQLKWVSYNNRRVAVFRGEVYTIDHNKPLWDLSWADPRTGKSRHILSYPDLDAALWGAECDISNRHLASSHPYSRLYPLLPDPRDELIRELVDALKAVEWEAADCDETFKCCPLCLGRKPSHAPDCKLDSSLRKAEGLRSGT